jgi:hypothetical protein
LRRILTAMVLLWPFRSRISLRDQLHPGGSAQYRRAA